MRRVARFDAMAYYYYYGGSAGSSARMAAGLSGSLILSLSPSLWLRASSLSSVGDGNAVAIDWPDLSGNGNNATPSAGPVFRANVWNSKAGIEFNGAGRKFVTPSFLTSGSDTAFTIYGVVQTVGPSLQVWASHNGVELYCAHDGSGTLFNTSGLSDTSIGLGCRDHCHITRLRYNGSTKAVRVKGKAGDFEDSEAATGNLGFDGSLTFGCLSNESFGWGLGGLLEVIVFQSVISDEDDDLVFDYLADHYGFNAVDHSSSDPIVVFYGNSLTLGTGSSTVHAAYPEVVIDSLGSPYIGVNKGASGATTPTLASAAASDLDPYFSSARSQNIAVIWEVSNHLFNGNGSVSAATAYNAYVSLCQAAQTAGFQVVAVTVLPRSDAGTYAGFNTDRATVNASIVANWATFADALADVAANTDIGQDGDSDNVTYYGDKVHLTDAGYAIVAGIVETAIGTL